ncbi:hypothetical protein OHC33_010593 [Knufia fluminis]|uniref:Uncharacterized protein n=1 Tax=Knufia fluminis TaxID=191047 RepID=A0AAN8E800_9EURO|nr:hypothetical protein OHC33_010593 [Knufia fluminis]
MEFNRHGLQAVIVPYLPADWKSVSNKRLGYSLQPRATDPDLHTYIGTSVYLRCHFQYQQLRVICTDAVADPITTDPNVGVTWVSSEHIDPSTGSLTSVLSTANAEGAYSYYPRFGESVDSLKGMQWCHAESYAGLLSKLPADCRKDLIRYLSAPTTTKPYTCSLPPIPIISTSAKKCGSKRPIDGDFEPDTVLGLSHTASTGQVGKTRESDLTNRSSTVGSSLASTCRLLNADAKALLFMENVFMFYCPSQLGRFLECATPGSALLKVWPRKFKHIVLHVRSRDFFAHQEERIEHTTVIPLSPRTYFDGKDKRSSAIANASNTGNSVTTAGPQTAMTSNMPALHGIIATTTTGLNPSMYGHPGTIAPAPAAPWLPQNSITQPLTQLNPTGQAAVPTGSVPQHTPGTNVQRDDARRGQPSQPPEITNDASKMLRWCDRVQVGLLTANLKHRHRAIALRRTQPASFVPPGSSQLQNDQQRTRQEKDKRCEWSNRVGNLLSTYKVERLDIVYGKGPDLIESPDNHVRSFRDPTAPEVKEFLLSL